jgi:hypothetical protein
MNFYHFNIVIYIRFLLCVLKKTGVSWEKARNGAPISSWEEPVRYYPPLQSASMKSGQLLPLPIITRPPFMPPCSPRLNPIPTVYIYIYFQCMEITSLVSISLFYLSLRFYAVNSIVQSIVVTIYLFIYELHHMISVFWKLNASIIISIMNGNIPSFLGRARSHCLSGRICRRRLWWIYQWISEV